MLACPAADFRRIGTLRNVSASGACIAVDEPQDAPDDFVLFLRKDGTVRRQCHIVWRGQSTIGVRFTDNAAASQL